MCSVFRSWENSPYAPPRVRFSLPGLHVSENSVRPCGAAGGSLIFVFACFLFHFRIFRFIFAILSLKSRGLWHSGSGMGRAWVGAGRGMGRAWVGHGSGRVGAHSWLNQAQTSRCFCEIAFFWYFFDKLRFLMFF